jgi:hypothetical protein
MCKGEIIPERMKRNSSGVGERGAGTAVGVPGFDVAREKRGALSEFYGTKWIPGMSGVKSWGC